MADSSAAMATDGRLLPGFGMATAAAGWTYWRRSLQTSSSTPHAGEVLPDADYGNDVSLDMRWQAAEALAARHILRTSFRMRPSRPPALTAGWTW